MMTIMMIHSFLIKQNSVIGYRSLVVRMLASHPEAPEFDFKFL